MMNRKAKLLLGLLPAIVAGIICYVAYRTRPVPTPRRKWKRFHQPGNEPLDAYVCKNLEGIYQISGGKNFFGATAVLKWSYVVEAKKTMHKLSLFCEKDGLYIICEGRRNGNEILLAGHWRRAAANGSGIVQLILSASSIGLLGSLQEGAILQGLFGDGDSAPNRSVSFHYQRILPEKVPLEIIGHRGGARNVDFLPVSENSLEMLKMAASIGATGVEIDVRLTKDEVPVIFHDSFLSIHTIQGKLYDGSLHNYTFEELRKFKLRKGGFIPTLEECLHTMLYQTPLETVWLDIKKECKLTEILKLQQKYSEKAGDIGRNFQIYIGIPDKTILKCFKEVPNYRHVPSLTELEPETALEVGAKVWAPQYTRGHQADNIAKIHSAGGKAFVWSLDSKVMIDLFLDENRFDGVVTNTPSVVAHWYYTSASKTPPGSF